MKFPIRILTFVLLLTLLPWALFAAEPPAPPEPPEAPPDDAFELELIELLKPADEFYQKSDDVAFSFKTDLVDLDECAIWVEKGRTDDELKTFSSPFTTKKDYTETKMKDGSYDWYVLCVDDAGEEYTSATRTFIVDTAKPTLALAPLSLAQGSFLTVTGAHFYPEEVVLTLSNGTDELDEWSVDAESDGTFEERLYIQYRHLPGVYELSSFQEDFDDSELLKEFTVKEPVLEVKTDEDVYFTGQTVKITGSGFPPTESLAIGIEKPGGGTYEASVTSSGLGAFTYSYALTGDRPAGDYEVTVSVKKIPELEATVSFEVQVQEMTNDDYDKDGVKNNVDNCPQKANPDQKDSDGDGKGDACDSTPNGVEETLPDYDKDGIPDEDDNCDVQPNRYQEDKDGDGFGDVCDPVDDSESAPPNNLPPPETQEPSSSGFPLLLIIILSFVLVLVGTVGYLSYEGKLDFSDLGGSLRALFHPASRGSASGAASQVDVATVKTFIFSQRSRGYDDLMIRNALLAKGWDEAEVDGIFQEIYAE